MTKFEVKNVIAEVDCTTVVLEPIEQPLFLQNEIVPGCIQHILSILKKNKDKKEECVKMCDILCDVNMDDNDSRKFYIYKQSHLYHIRNALMILADNRDTFNIYGGINLLFSLFEKHRDLSIIKALAHAASLHFCIFL